MSIGTGVKGPKRLPVGICDDCEGPTKRGAQAHTCWHCKDERDKKKGKRYRAENRQARTASQARRRARIRSAGGTVT